MEKYWATAPSNIALIKYMGKSAHNKPLNSSLSYTLERFRSYVEVTPISDAEDYWEPLSLEEITGLYREGILPDDMGTVSYAQQNYGEAEQKIFLKQCHRLREFYRSEQKFKVKSFNGFPASCGLASSASSFAALTMALDQAFGGQNKNNPLQLSEYSRLASGSSCRSFFSPWTLWNSEGVSRPEGLPNSFWHHVVVVSEESKKVSSSEAHQRVQSSLNFSHRQERAEKRLVSLMGALMDNQWARACEIAWAEFWDMHTLFETSAPPFGYINDLSMEVLQIVRSYWEREGDGPLVTMDAGPNVHLLFREDQEEDRWDLLEKLSSYKIL